MATRRKFSSEYKHKAVQLARSTQQPVSETARSLGIGPNLLGNVVDDLNWLTNGIYS
jgi:transposase-like protein